MTYPVWGDDARRALDRLRDSVELIARARTEPSAWPFESWSDLVPPRLWLLQVAQTQLHLARFYLSVAREGRPW